MRRALPEAGADKPGFRRYSPQAEGMPEVAQFCPPEPSTQEAELMRIPQLTRAGATGLMDKVVGLTKEIVGEVVDNESLIRNGENQQKKGTESLKASREDAKAKAHSAKARAHESRERSAQRAKENA
jgi:uncharacterized protein YjbJ (UPF0337 family)